MKASLDAVIPNHFKRVATLFEIKAFANEQKDKYPIARLNIEPSAEDQNELENGIQLYSKDLSDFQLYMDDTFIDHYIPLYEEIPHEDIMSLSASKCPSDVLLDFLEKGMHVLDDRGEKPVKKVFRFFGHSVYKLKKRECILYNEVHGSIFDIANKFGNFENILNPAKKAARMSLLLAPGTPTIRILNKDITMISDIKSEDGMYNFTDGAGFISLKTAKSIVEKLSNEDKEICKSEPYGVPSIFQIRTKSIKGILVLDPDLEDGMLIRDSMKKFEYTRQEPHLVNLVAISKPNEHGSLNEQYVRILEFLEIPTEVFCSKLKSYLNRVRQLNKDEENMDAIDKREELQWGFLNDAVKTITSKSMRERAIQVEYPDLEPRDYHWSKMLEHLCIPIPESRSLFGMPDPTGILKENECFFQISINGTPTVISGREVIIGRCPSYHPGDMQKLNAVDVEELRYLTECIVFPGSGNFRPMCNQLSGGDLDGDTYAVFWDKDLIPRQCHTPQEYEDSSSAIGQSVNESKGKVNVKTLLKHYCEYDCYLMANIDRCFKHWFQNKWAGIASEECLKLAQLFSQAVDAPKTGRKVEIPKHLWVSPKAKGKQNRGINSENEKKEAGENDEQSKCKVEENCQKIISPDGCGSGIYASQQPESRDYFNVDAAEILCYE